LTKPEQWVEDYGDYLYRYALSRICDPAMAEDLVQETFLAGIKGLGAFDNRVEIKFWLRGILRNKVVDYIRKDVRLKYVAELEEFDEHCSQHYCACGKGTLRKRYGCRREA